MWKTPYRCPVKCYAPMNSVLADIFTSFCPLPSVQNFAFSPGKPIWAFFWTCWGGRLPPHCEYITVIIWVRSEGESASVPISRSPQVIGITRYKQGLSFFERSRGRWHGGCIGTDTSSESGVGPPTRRTRDADPNTDYDNDTQRADGE